MQAFRVASRFVGAGLLDQVVIATADGVLFIDEDDLLTIADEVFAAQDRAARGPQRGRKIGMPLAPDRLLPAVW